MTTYTMTVFAGSAMLTYESHSLFGIVNAMRELGTHMPAYADAFGDNEEMDKIMERLVQLKNSKLDALTMKTPYVRIERHIIEPCKEG